MNEEQLDLFATPQARRDDGMRRAEEHADRVTHAWSALAYGFVHQYVAGLSGADVFITEKLVEAARAAAIPDPPDARAWGSIINRAARNGLIVKSGYAEDRFCSPKTVWRRA